MVEIWQFGIGLGVSLTLAALRYRLPSVQPQMASAGIGIGLALIGLSFAWPGWPLAISIMLNAAFAAVLIDQGLTAKAKTPSDVAGQAELTKQERLALKEARNASEPAKPLAPPHRLLTGEERSALIRRARTRHGLNREAAKPVAGAGGFEVSQ